MLLLLNFIETPLHFIFHGLETVWRCSLKLIVNSSHFYSSIVVYCSVKVIAFKFCKKMAHRWMQLLTIHFLNIGFEFDWKQVSTCEYFNLNLRS